MVNKIVQNIITFLGVTSGAMFGKYLVVFLISLMPILELRGGLIAAALLGLDPVTSFFVTFVGTLLPIPFILLLLEYIFEFMKKHNILKKFVMFCEKKGHSKKGSVEKYGFWGLVIFVGIPLPGTGAWTGTLIAVLLRMNKKKAFAAIVLGTLIASIIMMLVSYGILANIF